MIKKLVMFDIETTGLFPQRGDRIIEIGAISLEDNKILETFHTYINPERPIANSAQKIHGINKDMLAGQPTPESALRVFNSFVSGNILISHNAKFDVRFLRYEFSRLGLNLTNKYLCTLVMSRNFFPDLPDHRLETVYRHVAGCSTGEIKIHRALDDARLVAEIWMKLGVAAMDSFDKR